MNFPRPVLAAVAAAFFLSLAAPLLAAPASAATGELAKRVIILANSDDPDSLRVARHYAEARAVPFKNIIAKKMSVAETITWREFIATIWQPLYDELTSRQWIDAIPIDVTDSMGRKKYSVNGHHIAALVVCRGVPLKIAHEPEFYTAHAPITDHQPYRTNAGAVDSELSLLPLPGYNINGFVPNPLFRNDHPSEVERAQVIPVGRLDGPTTDDALALVDRAITAERTGLIGRAYVDIGGLYPEGDQWMEAVAAQLLALGFDTAIDRAPATMPATARADAPVLYFGWYAGDLNGPFALPGFQFPPGAIALHIHSFSASTLHSATTGWTGPFVAHGVTATVGNVFEPYLARTHHPVLFLQALARGASVGEAACYSLSALSWQAVLVGDPLYRPFAVSLEEQRKKRAPVPLAGYLVLREMHLLEAAGKKSEALALLRAAQHDAPSLPVGLALARKLQEAGDVSGAAAALEFAGGLKAFRTDEWALASEAAEVLVASDRPAQAMAIYLALLGIKSVPPELRAAWLPNAAKAALAAHDTHQAQAWTKELADRNGPAAGK